MGRRRGWIVVTLLLLAQAALVVLANAVYDTVESRVFWVAYLIFATLLFVALLIQLQHLARRR